MKKILALSIAVILTAGIFTGCSKSADKNVNKQAGAAIRQTKDKIKEISKSEEEVVPQFKRKNYIWQGNWVYSRSMDTENFLEGNTLIKFDYAKDMFYPDEIEMGDGISASNENFQHIGLVGVTENDVYFFADVDGERWICSASSNDKSFWDFKKLVKVESKWDSAFLAKDRIYYFDKCQDTKYGIYEISVSGGEKKLLVSSDYISPYDIYVDLDDNKMMYMYMSDTTDKMLKIGRYDLKTGESKEVASLDKDKYYYDDIYILYKDGFYHVSSPNTPNPLAFAKVDYSSLTRKDIPVGEFNTMIIYKNKIYYLDRDNGSIYSMNLDGSNNTKLPSDEYITYFTAVKDKLIYKTYSTWNSLNIN